MTLKLLIAAAVAVAAASVGQARAALLWDWSYNGLGVDASGTFTTDETTDADGFFQITGITGTRDGVTITGLQPTGTAIPGNEPYDVDNLISITGPQLTSSGFGYSLADGSYSNPFYNNGYYDFFSYPPFGSDDNSEPSVSFEANIVREPSTAALVLAGLLGLVATGRLGRDRDRNLA